MKVLVTFAVDAEFAPWRKLRNLKPIEVNGQRMYRALIGRAMVDVVVTGMGVANAERVTDLVLSEGYQFCISSGFAGALRPDYKLGDVLAAKAVQRIGKPKTLESSRNLFHEAANRGARRANLFLTSDQLVATAAEKARLGPFGEAVEMESFGVFAAAQRKSVPAIAIRVISDTADRDLPLAIETLVNEYGKVKIGAVVRYLVHSPLRVRTLFRLGRESGTVAGILADFLEAFIKQLSFCTRGWYPEGTNLQEVALR